jgi:hypothetical protein
MNKYLIFVITGDNIKRFKVIAEDLKIENRFYRFISKYETVAYYPNNFTIIESIEKIEEDNV